MNRKINKIFSGITILALMLMALPMQSALAAPTELFFSEYIEGSSNNKALEIYNGTGAAINLGTSGYNVQMFFNGSATAGLTINLVGIVANGDVFVVAQASAVAAILAQADQTNGAGWFNGDDAVVLRKGTTVIDVIGQIGFDPGTEWGTGLASTADNTLNRKGSVCAGEPNGADVFDPSVEWDGSATDTFGGLGAHTANCGGTPNISINDVSANEGNAGTTSFDFTVSLSAPAGPGGVTFDIATADGTATTADSDYAANSLTGQTIPAGSSTYAFSVPVNGDTTEEPDETFLVNVTNVVGATVTDGQGQGTIVNDDTNFCAQTYTPIYQIQGSGTAAAITGNVTTQGVVVGDFEGTASASGFYLQDVTGDENVATSDGIFVFTGSSDLVNVGDVVRVTGFARERFNQTALNGSNSNTAAVPAANIINCGTGSVPPVDVTMPFADANYLERFEGMLVRFPQELVIAEYFNYARFGEIVLALPLAGEPRPFSGTAIDEPGAAANARTLANSLRRITLDDAQSAQNPPVLRHPNGDPFSLTNRFRGGDTVQNAVGVLGFDFSLYRIFPTGPASYTAENPRPTEPEPVGGSIRVAAMNTLNFFVTLDTTVSDNGPGPCGANQNLDCRGADADQPDEFSRQRDKLLAALSGLDADIIGLNELESTPGAEPLESIAAGMPGYAYINTGPIGTDAIKVGMIYRSAVVTPVGAYQILDSTDDPRFIDTKSRPSLAQTFEVNATGARFTVVVNHLKSKGSACDDVGDPDLGDGQGNCSQTRRAAAEALVDWLATDPTGSGDPDFLIVGDLNSYAQEDTIDEIKAGSDDTPGTDDDFTNLIAQFQGAFAYSYTFDGQAGYLDYALANQSLLPQVTGAADWHINSDEPDVLDYDTSFKPPAQDALYEVNPYRTSDHDPVVVGLAPINQLPTADAGGPYTVVEGGSVTLNATGADPEGTAVTFDWDLDNDGTFETPGQSVSFSPSAAAPAVLTVKVRVTDAFGNFAVDETTVSVLYNFTGFFQPVDNMPTVNSVKAGQSVPIRFSLNGDHGLDIFAAGYPKIEFTSCTSSTVDAVEETVTAGNSSLTYDPATDEYTYVWKTNKSWGGKCGTLQVTFNDGTTQTALFKFTK